VFATGLPKALDVAKAIDKLGDHPEEATRWKGGNGKLKRDPVAS